MATSRISLKLVIDPKLNKVLFAEAGKDFVDFLFSLLCLPLGAAINLLGKGPPFDFSIANLYNSLENLNVDYMQRGQNKDLLLKPRLPIHALNVPLFLPDTAPEQPVKKKLVLYGCNEPDCSEWSVTDLRGTNCLGCGTGMYELAYFIEGNNSEANENSKAAGYLKGIHRYMVMDDLSVSPISSIVSAIDILNENNVKDIGAFQEKIVDVGVDEGLALLKASLQTRAALTSVFIRVEGKLPRLLKIN